MRHPPLGMLKAIFGKYPGIQAVYLFGSSATGRARAESDLDLAVLADDAKLRARKVDILAELAANGFCNVDLVFLPDNDIVLQYEAVRLNRLLYQRPDFDGAATFSSRSPLSGFPALSQSSAQGLQTEGPQWSSLKFCTSG